MKFTVDASVVLKWFIRESLSTEAHELLAPRLVRHAPGFLLVEVANVLWKKARGAGAAGEAHLVFAEMPNLPEIVTLHSDRVLLGRAAELALGLDHPVYDCLYLACSEATDAPVISADRRLVRKVRTAVPDFSIGDLHDPEVVREIRFAATALAIETATLERLIAAQELFESTQKGVAESLPPAAGGLRFLGPEDIALSLDSPAWVRLTRLVEALGAEEQIDLLALGWLGYGHFGSDWQRCLEHAYRNASHVTTDYIAGYGRHWRAGHARVSSA